jgi:hypothetical protein
VADRAGVAQGLDAEAETADTQEMAGLVRNYGGLDKA